ncbi:MAG: helix-turn-helix domain-containing protein [Treponema sp.]|nr:helix-turn-helix domain-containing protein [Treponema sp.]
MESYGALLRNAREEKKLSIEAVERETTISKQYIEALENESTEIFHGEAYLVGFLRNYAEFLELDSHRLIHLYRNMMIQESPVPEGLIEKPRPRFLIPGIVGGSIALVLIAVLSIYFSISYKNRIERERNYAVSEKNQQKIYEISDKPMNERVYIGDQITFNAKDGAIVLTVASDTNSRLGLTTPVGVQYFELSETRELDLDGDAAVDIVVDVWEISSNDQSRGAEVYIVKKSDVPVQEVPANTITVAKTSSSVNYTHQILEDNRAYPFSIDAYFRNPCVFRYECDRKTSVENYYTTRDSITFQANNAIRLWMSNGNTVKLQVVADGIPHELEIEKAGECIVEDIKWIRSDDGRYRLVVVPLD